MTEEILQQARQLARSGCTASAALVDLHERYGKLRAAVISAGFGIMETSGDWSVHCTTDAAKKAEEVEGDLIADNIQLRRDLEKAYEGMVNYQRLRQEVADAVGSDAMSHTWDQHLDRVRDIRESVEWFIRLVTGDPDGLIDWRNIRSFVESLAAKIDQWRDDHANVATAERERIKAAIAPSLDSMTREEILAAIG